MSTKKEFNDAIKHIKSLMHYEEIFLNDPKTEKIYEEAQQFLRRIAQCTPKP